MSRIFTVKLSPVEHPVSSGPRSTLRKLVTGTLGVDIRRIPSVVHKLVISPEAIMELVEPLGILHYWSTERFKLFERDFGVALFEPKADADS
jgi:hypothetical protein